MSPVRDHGACGMTALPYKVDAETGCWIGRGAQDARGYVMARVGRRTKRAHIVMYELAVGPVPAGTELDHLCRVTSCVNPDHLEPVSHAENIRRGRGTKLLASQVAEIKAQPAVPTSILADRYGVSRTTIYLIRRGDRWADIAPLESVPSGGEMDSVCIDMHGGQAGVA